LNEKGKGVKQDDFKALKFYQKACDLNYGGGCSNLGFMYEEGKGGNQAPH
jgi:TPR repeat protein